MIWRAWQFGQFAVVPDSGTLKAFEYAAAATSSFPPSQWTALFAFPLCPQAAVSAFADGDFAELATSTYIDRIVSSFASAIFGGLYPGYSLSPVRWMACIGVVVPEIVEIGNKQSNEQLQNSS